nr:hypothetical protein [Pueribacillus theae]
MDQQSQQLLTNKTYLIRQLNVITNIGLELESERIQEKSLKDAASRDLLVLGIDNFATRKGHKYNTGLHDLKGGSFFNCSPDVRMKN